jgi:hypothetical protein
MYSHILGGALNCFVALDKITPDKATLWVAPKSHLNVNPTGLAQIVPVPPTF